MNKVIKLTENELHNLIKESLQQIIIESKKRDFWEKHGITRKEGQIGFSPKEQKWYGWSHRAIYGYGVGDKIKKGACGYEEMIKTCPEGTIKTLDTAKKIAQIFAKAVS